MRFLDLHCFINTTSEELKILPTKLHTTLTLYVTIGTWQLYVVAEHVGMSKYVELKKRKKIKNIL